MSLAITKVDYPVSQVRRYLEPGPVMLVERYNFFIFEVVKAHVATSPEHPETIHYTGKGECIRQYFIGKSVKSGTEIPEPRASPSGCRRVIHGAKTAFGQAYQPER
ncbi:Uncharacterised protein [Klebsiella pneumoniae]|uniref:Uncharacterized protein n=1 Tax=Klebsiella pneumoniae TaxID=573 RepID=A0A377X8V6_KLEPN|nr:Uncharacterised protein [Klebsiella pneumoniae]STV69150.1 Uncharacterised protein [Klebsiella pneumoniae subsp. rhinoscleromatis]STT82358.1 Uncharacterised protein [Klebsiella pneumoniae]STU10055.1 Uncharacterised protein [Klebsiella pneumoniae]STW10920.1 Uncharacterised protein [Klebsiella pneumoniae subsp. rhinoscleromatis]